MGFRVVFVGLGFRVFLATVSIVGRSMVVFKIIMCWVGTWEIEAFFSVL